MSQLMEILLADQQRLRGEQTCCEHHGANCAQGRKCPASDRQEQPAPAEAATEIGADAPKRIGMTAREALIVLLLVTVPWAMAIAGVAVFAR